MTPPKKEFPHPAAGLPHARTSPAAGWGFFHSLKTSLQLLLLLLATTVHAHHGRDFILIQDSAIPARFGGVVTGGLEWKRYGAANEWSTEPGIFLGLAPALGVGLNAGFGDEGRGWAYTGITPQIVLTLLPATGARNLRVGFWAGYEFAEEDDESSFGLYQQARAALSAGAGSSNSGGSGPDAGRRYQPRHAGHSLGTSLSDQRAYARGFGGIHRHGESGLHSRLIVEADLMKNTRVIANLVNFASSQGGPPGWGYAAGLRHEFSHDLSLGVEAIGDFRSFGSSHQVLLTAMTSITHHLALRFGIGGGLTSASPDVMAHSGLLWRF